MELAGKKILVIGMGKTGVAVSSFLGAHGAAVLAIDEKPRQAWGTDAGRLRQNPWFGAKDYDPSALAGVDLVVPSPGVPPLNIILEAARKKNIPIMSEIELACLFIETPILAITGTNGKTTTTTLLGRIFGRAGKKVFVGGNIGNPLVQYAAGDKTADFVIAEISSFQLQWASKRIHLRPSAAGGSGRFECSGCRRGFAGRAICLPRDALQYGTSGAAGCVFTGLIHHIHKPRRERGDLSSGYDSPARIA